MKKWLMQSTSLKDMTLMNRFINTTSAAQLDYFAKCFSSFILSCVVYHDTLRHQKHSIENERLSMLCCLSDKYNRSSRCAMRRGNAHGVSCGSREAGCCSVWRAKHAPLFPRLRQTGRSKCSQASQASAVIELMP